MMHWLLSTKGPLRLRSGWAFWQVGWPVGSLGGSGLLQHAFMGIVGSLVGGVLLERLGVELGIRSPLTSRIVTATFGAVVVILAARLLA